MRRVEETSFDVEGPEDLVELLRRSESDLVIPEKLRRFGGRRERTRDAARIGERRELRQPRRAHWRLRVSADDMNDAIEFEDAQGSGVHLEEEWSYRRQGNRQL